MLPSAVTVSLKCCNRTQFIFIEDVSLQATLNKYVGGYFNCANLRSISEVISASPHEDFNRYVDLGASCSVNYPRVKSKAWIKAKSGHGVKSSYLLKCHNT